MSDQPKQPRSISEISHLFLSSVRDRQTGGAGRPVRTPPLSQQSAPQPPSPMHAQPPGPSVDLTPEEYAQVFGGPTETSDSAEMRIPPITAVVAQHLNGRAPERVRDYARHLAANGERVGLIEIDAAETRLMCFERSLEPNAADPAPAEISEHFDARTITESLDEMSWDIDRWLLVMPNVRSPEARGILKEINHWVLLSTCDHDGVVSCYRSIKGLANVGHPRLSLALLEAPSDTIATRVFAKLAGVCLQFLGVELASEPAVRPTRAVAEHVVAHCRPTRDKAQLAAGAQWLVLSNFIARAKSQPAPVEAADEPAAPSAVEPVAAEPALQAEPEMEIETVMPVSPVREQPLRMASAPEIAHPVEPAPHMTSDPVSEVIDLPGDADDDRAVLSAILGGSSSGMIECPVRPPMCPEARLAVTRDRGLLLIAVARKGLRDLRAIAQAYRWLIENRALIGMAVPQLSIDGHRHPALRLLVDHADLSADALAPMLESANVTVQAYRKLRWGGKMGLLLDAA